jgi:hypothetical protein
MTLVQDFLYLATAVILGAAIGFERQWRQRLAGLSAASTCPIRFENSNSAPMIVSRRPSR